MKVRNLLVCAAFALLLCGCSDGKNGVTGNSAAEAKREIFAMDTVMYVTAYGDNAQAAVDAAAAEISRLDALLSVGSDSSEISRLNSTGKGELSADTKYLVERSLEFYGTTDGAYDMTVSPLMELWGFTGTSPAVPDESDIQKTLARCGSDKISLSGSSISLGEAGGIDLGGIAKGYTGDRIMKIYSEYGVTSGMISLGGNVQCYGAKPDGSMWRCGITDPLHPYENDRFLGIVSIRGKAVVTSGGYERSFTENGHTYHHIMDMKTGYPAESGLISVTIVSSDGTKADALSTACFVMGAEKAADYWRRYGDDFDIIMQTDTGRIMVTEGLASAFECTEPFEIIKKTGS